jgi:hypothetical protein
MNYSWIKNKEKCNKKENHFDRFNTNIFHLYYLYRKDIKINYLY